MVADNLAYNKSCRQTDTYDQYRAEKAVNGELNDFTHTKSESVEEWWMVDLEAKFHVSRIKIYNRKENSCYHCMYHYNRGGTCYYMYRDFLIKMIWFYILN